MAKPVKLLLSDELLEIWRAELGQAKCEESTAPGFTDPVLVVLELTSRLDEGLLSQLKASELPIIVVTDFSRQALVSLEQLRNRVVGLCDREAARLPTRVVEYLKTGLLLGRTLASMKDQKVIWTAKTSLMEKYHLSEAEAHRRLQTASMRTGRNLREISQALLMAEEVAKE